MNAIKTSLLACAAMLFASAAAQADTVRMTVSYYSAATGPYFEKMAAEFTKQNPGIDVKIQVVNWDGLLQKLRTDIAGGVNSDILMIARLPAVNALISGPAASSTG